MLSPQIQQLVDNLKNQSGTSLLSGPEDTRIKVNALTSKAGALYEKIRYFIDYKEEHTIRRSAIERIIKRKVLIESDPNIGISLLEELVSGGYLPNDRISESAADDVQKILNRFLLVKEYIGSKLLGNIKLKSKLIGLASSEIDLFLYPTPNDDLVAEAFYLTVKDSIKYKGELDREAFETQIYVACRRTLLKNDDATIFYSLWIRSIPGWSTIETAEDLQKTGFDFFSLIEKNTQILEDDVRWQLQSKLRNYALYFAVLKEVVDQYGSESERILNDPNYLDDQVETILEKKYAKENSRIKKSGKRAVVYIFCTKILLAFLIEVPYDLFFVGFLNYTALVTNIVFHPTLLLLMTRNIKPLGKKNTDKILEGLHKLLYANDIKTISIRPQRTGFLLNLTFSAFYGVLFLISFGIIVWILLFFSFNIVSIGLFLLFLTFVSYFGLRIRYTAETWRVRSDDEGTIALIWNLFTLPIIRMGRFLSTKFQSINVFVFIMDFLIEVPFKLILTTSDAFLSFLKEKREETY